MYAVIQTGGKQYRVTPGDVVEVERLTTDKGQPHVFDQVLLINKDDDLEVGHPKLDAASVEADVVDHVRGPKVVAFKMKRRKGYQRKVGHRQELTVVKIKEIKA